MESLLVTDILQFADCDFVIVDSSLTILHSNKTSSINKCITEIFPYSLIKETIQQSFTELSHQNNKSIIQSPDVQYPYTFSLHKTTCNDCEAVVIVARLNKKFPDIIRKIYEDLYAVPYLNDADHFVDVFDYILDTLIKITGMDCGGIYFLEPLTKKLKLAFAKGVSPSFIEKTSEYSADSWNYELVMKGTPQYVDYTKIELANNDFRKKEGIKAIVTVPIKIKNSLIGTINIGSHSTATISETIFPLLEAISNQIGILLDRFIVKAILAQSTIEKEKISSLHDIVYQVDKDTIIRYVSTNIKNVIGYSSSEIIGKSFVDLIHPEDLPMVMESYERVKKRILEPLEYRLKTKDGSYRYILTISEAHFDKQGHYIGLSGIGVDIHEKKMTQIKLQESEAKFKALANSVGTAIFIIQDNILVWINPATAMVLECPEQEILGKPFWIFVHPDDVEIAKERAKARQNGDDVINRYEARIITKNNKVKWIDFNVTTIQYNGSIAILGSASDISYLKKIEFDLKNSEEKFYKAFHSTPIPMTINTFDDGVYREVNEAACRIFNYTPQESIGRSIFDLNVFADEEELTKYINELRENKKVKDFNVTFRAKTGLLKDCIINSDVFISSGQKFVISSIVDVTQIKRSSQIIFEQYRELQKINKDLTRVQDELKFKNIQLFEEKERLNLILESINDAVIVTDIHGAIVLVNNATCKLLGKDYESLIAKQVIDCIDLDCKPEFDFNFHDILNILKYESINRECVLHINTQQYNIELHILPLKDATGKLNGAVVILRDITQKKLIEEHITRTSKLESVGLLAAGIAHDFNNILTSIVGNLSIIKNKINPYSEFYTNIEEAENASFRAKELTRQLLTFAKGGAPVKKVTSLTAILKDTATFILRGSGIQCHFDIDDSLYPAEVDEGQIAQVIQNLVINAREAMADHGVLHITAKNIDDNDPVHGIIGNDRYIKITIQDNGRGIKSEHIEKIFDPYFTTKPHGSGLGLTVVHSIIKQHGGYIFVDSKPGAGTRFDIYLKATEKHSEKIAGQSNNITVTGKGKVLVLEDDENIQFILRTMLEELGYEVDIATDGDEAFNKYLLSKESGKNYAFAIMDLTIPGKKGGKDTITQIRKIDNDFKVIVSSGYSNDPVMSNYQDYGFNGILPKPYRFEDLKQIIAAISY